MHGQKLLDEVLDGYVECALWSSFDDEGEPLDGLYGPGDIADSAMVDMAHDVGDFLDYCEAEGIDISDLSPSQVGHDFWLTRNGHGAGFWDRGLGELGDRLTAAAHSYGESYLYVGDDGVVYVA